jgi:hypothetical protein
MIVAAGTRQPNSAASAGCPAAAPTDRASPSDDNGESSASCQGRAAVVTRTAGHFALGAAYLWSKDLDRAQAEAQRCLELSPNSADRLRMTVHIQIFSGDPATAVENLEAYM